MIRNENGLLAGYIYVDTATTDIGGYVAVAQRSVAARVTLPQGYTLNRTGQYEFQVRARERLHLVIPIVLACIFFFFFLPYRSSCCRSSTR